MAAERRGAVATLVLLMATMLLAFFAANSAAARSPRNVQQLIPVAALKTALARAVIGSAVGDDEPCCECACIMTWTFLSVCECRGDWEGSCPSICSKCVCDNDNICSCQDGFSHNDLICSANACPPFESSAKGRLPANKGSTKEDNM